MFWWRVWPERAAPGSIGSSIRRLHGGGAKSCPREIVPTAVVPPAPPAGVLRSVPSNLERWKQAGSCRLPSPPFCLGLQGLLNRWGMDRCPKALTTPPSQFGGVDSGFRALRPVQKVQHLVG